MTAYPEESVVIEEEYEEVEWKLPSRVRAIIIALIFISIGASASTVYFYRAQVKLQKKYNTEDSMSSSNIRTLRDAIGAIEKLMVLPDDEEPTYATVSDPAQLSGQQFFRGAEIGDVVLMYEKSKRAILYSPKKNKIIEVGLLVLPDQSVSEGSPAGIMR